MKNFLKSTVVTAGLAIFSMFFGAGNLILPIQAGFNSGDKFYWGMAGYMLTAVILPLIGLIAMILFNGDYKAFFQRLGRLPGFIAILCCMCVIGPCISMSRIVTLSYEMLAPFMTSFVYNTAEPVINLQNFSIIFCILTFIATYKESRIINILGTWISPLLLGSLTVIIIKGVITPHEFVAVAFSRSHIFFEQLEFGYASLDLLGGLFFASAALTILKKNLMEEKDYNLRTLAATGMKAGLIGCTLLGLIYYGLSLIGAYYGPQFTNVTNPASLFSQVSFAVMGQHGAFIIAIAVAMACYSTIIALAMVLAEYIHKELSLGFISYIMSLILTLIATAFLSSFGLETIMTISGPIINACYPVLIVITFCNIGYKLFNFTPIKVPALFALLLSFYWNFDQLKTIIGL